MAEQNQAGTTQPANAAVVQPASAPSTPAIDPGEFARLQRIEQQWKGQQGFYEKARTYGLKDETSLDQWGGAIKNLSSKGVNPQALMQAFSATDDGEGRTGKEAVADVEELLGRKMSEFEKKFVRQQAEKEHNSAMDSELAELTPESIKKLLGEDAPAAMQEFARYAAIGRHMELRQPYEESHPMHGMLKPVGKDGLGTISSWLAETKKALMTAQKTDLAAKIGDAASKSKSNGTVAGSVPAGPPGNSNNKRPGGLPSKEEVQAAYEQRLAKHGR